MKSITHYINSVKCRTNNYIYKRKGWKTDRKILVIESDDWGSIRMPSTNVLNNLLEKGVKFHPGITYDKYDTLASNDDLELLMDVLNSVRDSNNNPAIMTLNSVVANPHFGKIKTSGYTEYHYEPFIETLKRYPNHDRSFDLWKEGMAHKIFRPQFHCREHLNVQMWLEALRNDYPGVREAFGKEVFSSYIDKKFDGRIRFLEAYNLKDKSEYSFINNSITDGLRLFENIFGYKSKSMIAPNYIWDNKIEEYAYANGIKYIQGSTRQLTTLYCRNKSKNSCIYHYMGEKNWKDQIYLIRNCLFEPSQNKNYNSERCLRDIEVAFKHHKPAIISSHRLNFIGGLDEGNRDNNLKELISLLKRIIMRHPSIEFMASDELGNLIQNS